VKCSGTKTMADEDQARRKAIDEAMTLLDRRRRAALAEILEQHLDGTETA